MNFAQDSDQAGDCSAGGSLADNGHGTGGSLDSSPMKSTLLRPRNAHDSQFLGSGDWRE